MASRAQLFGGGVLVLLGVSGCPVTDDYYIDAHSALTAGSGDQSGGAEATTGGTKDLAGSSSSGGSAGKSSGGTSTSGSAGTTAKAGDSSMGGAAETPLAGAGPGDAGAGDGPCVATTERCNGHDDDCDDLVDELACNSNANGTTGCTGFVVTAGSHHGYMLCTGNAKDYTHAKDACAGQEMRLAWLESAEENAAVSATIKKLTTQDILFGADDIAKEGDWSWAGAGGFQFFKGGETGVPVDGNYNNWAPQTPNNANNNEDCAVLNPMTGFWGDRNCSGYYAYLCEEQN